MKELSDKILIVIKENPEIINWDQLCKEYRIPYNIIVKNLNSIPIKMLLVYQDLPETFIERYIFKKDLVPIICENQNLSVRFMYKYREILDWELMSFYQDIPEELIRKVIDKVNMDDIILRQKVSKKFLDDYDDRIDKEYLNSLYCKFSNL